MPSPPVNAGYESLSAREPLFSGRARLAPGTAAATIEEEDPSSRSPSRSATLRHRSLRASGLTARSVSGRVQAIERLDKSKYARRCPVIYPKGSIWYDRWNVVILVTLIVVIFTTPYDTVFMPLKIDAVFALNRLTDAIFTLDLLFNFFVAVPNPIVRGCYITDSWTIAKTYICSSFLIDAISVMSGPADIYCVLAGRKLDTFPMLGRLRLLRAVKLSQVMASGHLNELRVMSGLTNWKLSMSWLIFLLVVCCHWTACLWGGIVFGSPQEETWLVSLEAAKGGPPEFYQSGWNIYVLSVYWAIMTITTIGYGDITPQNPTEYYVTIFCMAVMAALWTYVIGEICAILSTSSPHQALFRRNTDDMNWLMEEWDVPQEFRRRVRRFLHEGRNMERHHKNKQIVNLVSPTMQGELTAEVNQAWMDKIPYLEDLETDATGQLMHYLEFKMFAPQEEEHFDATLCVVARGTCARRGRVVARFGFWGEDMILENPMLRDEAPTRALSYVELLALRLDHLKKVMNWYPNLKKKVRRTKVHMGLRRGVHLISRVLRQLDYEETIDLKALSRAEHLALADAVLSGIVTIESTAAQIQRRFGIEFPAARSSLMGSGSLHSEDASPTYGSGDAYRNEAALRTSETGSQQSDSLAPLSVAAASKSTGHPSLSHHASSRVASTSSLCLDGPMSRQVSPFPGYHSQGSIVPPPPTSQEVLEELRIEAELLTARVNKDLTDFLAKAQVVLTRS